MCTTSGRGLWKNKIYHFDPNHPPSSGGDELQSEFFILYEDIVEVLEAIYAIAPQIKEFAQIMEIRPVKADDFLMSPAYGKNVTGIHFTWYKKEKEVKQSILLVQKQIEKYLVSVHWGKIFLFDKVKINKLYKEQILEFKKLQKKMDPRSVFVNSYFIEKFGNPLLSNPKL